MPENINWVTPLRATLSRNIQFRPISWLHTDAVCLHVLLYVHIQAVLLGEGRFTQLTLVGLLSCVQPLVNLQVVGYFKALSALSAHVRTLSQMAFLMLAK